VPVVVGFAGGVDADDGAELRAVGCHHDLVRDGSCVDVLDAADIEGLGPGQAQGGGGLAGAVLQRQHAHADQVGPVDALEGLDQDRAHAEQQGALGGPVAG
jgi:hypothetical protein